MQVKYLSLYIYNGCEISFIERNHSIHVSPAVLSPEGGQDQSCFQDQRQQNCRASSSSLSECQQLEPFAKDSSVQTLGQPREADYGQETGMAYERKGWDGKQWEEPW